MVQKLLIITQFLRYFLLRVRGAPILPSEEYIVKMLPVNWPGDD